MRYFLEFAYNGENYFGYQRQPNQITVQEQLESALSTVLRENIQITGAGRTDTGVHARKIFAHFDIEIALPAKLADQLNSFLPPDIAIHRIFEVPQGLHARFDAIYRTYEYWISTVKDPFSENAAWQLWRRSLDLPKMNEAAKILFEYDDFESFAKVGGDNKTTLCKIHKAEWRAEGNMLIFTITANRFLRNMVRAIVGTLVEVGSGKIAPQDLHRIIAAKNRNAAGTSVPAHGLYLVDVGYYSAFFNINSGAQNEQ